MMNFSAGERAGSNRENNICDLRYCILSLRLHLDVRISKGKNTSEDRNSSAVSSPCKKTGNV